MLRIGLRTHDLGKKFSIWNIDELSDTVETLGGKSIQLALGKAFEEMKDMKGKLTPGLGNELRISFDRYGFNVSVLGCYINMGNPNEEKRKAELEKFKEHVRFATYLGNPIVGTETGCINEEYEYTPKNDSEEAFEVFMICLRTMAAEAEKFGIVVGIEGVTKHIISTPEKMKRALDEINSTNVQVIFDPVNFLDISNYEKQDEIVKKSFELFGDRIAVIHAKDFIVENGEFKVVEAGAGQFNYELLISLLKERKPHIDILLENSSRNTAASVIAKLNSKF